MKKTETMKIETKASLKDVIWATLEAATGSLKDRVNKTGLIEFDFNGCKIECVVYSPKDSG